MKWINFVMKLHKWNSTGETIQKLAELSKLEFNDKELKEIQETLPK